MMEKYKLLNFENTKFKILHIEEATECEYLMEILNIEETKESELYVFGIATANETNHKKFIQSFEMIKQEGEEKFYVKCSKFMYKDWKLDFIDESGESIIRKVRDQKSLGEIVDEFRGGRMSKEELACTLDQLVEMKNAGEKKNDNRPETKFPEHPKKVQEKFSFMIGEVPEDIKEILDNENQEVKKVVPLEADKFDKPAV